MLNILVVDDSAMARKRISETLLKFDINHTIVAEAEDGVQALEMFHKFNPNLILTDLEMPRMHGLQLIEELRKLNSSLDIVVISALINEQIRQTLKHDRYLDFTKKPIDEKRIKHILQKLEHKIQNKVRES